MTFQNLDDVGRLQLYIQDIVTYHRCLNQNCAMRSSSCTVPTDISLVFTTERN